MSASCQSSCLVTLNRPSPTTSASITGTRTNGIDVGCLTKVARLDCASLGDAETPIAWNAAVVEVVLTVVVDVASPETAEGMLTEPAPVCVAVEVDDAVIVTVCAVVY